MKFMTIVFCLLIVSFSNASSLNTLLMTQDNRNILNEMRNQGLFKHLAVENKKQDLRLTGVVFRKGHQPIVFVNDKNTMNSRYINKMVHVHTKSISLPKAKIKVTKNNFSQYMMPGQIWSSKNEKIIEAYKLEQE